MPSSHDATGKLKVVSVVSRVDNPHVIVAETTLAAGQSSYVARYLEVSAGITYEVDLDADLEIG